MIKNAQNKAINSENIETKDEKVKENYFFAGGLKYKPKTIAATTREEAEEQWIKTREKAN